MDNSTTPTAEARAKAIVDETRSNLAKTIEMLTKASADADSISNFEDLVMFYRSSQEFLNIAYEIQRGIALSKVAPAMPPSIPPPTQRSELQ